MSTAMKRSSLQELRANLLLHFSTGLVLSASQLPRKVGHINAQHPK
jgi:hypothetical protein